MYSLITLASLFLTLVQFSYPFRYFASLSSHGEITYRVPPKPPSANDLVTTTTEDPWMTPPTPATISSGEITVSDRVFEGSASIFVSDPEALLITSVAIATTPDALEDPNIAFQDPDAPNPQLYTAEFIPTTTIASEADVEDVDLLSANVFKGNVEPSEITQEGSGDSSLEKSVEVLEATTTEASATVLLNRSSESIDTLPSEAIDHPRPIDNSIVQQNVLPSPADRPTPPRVARPRFLLGRRLRRRFDLGVIPGQFNWRKGESVVPVVEAMENLFQKLPKTNSAAEKAAIKQRITELEAVLENMFKGF